MFLPSRRNLANSAVLHFWRTAHVSPFRATMCRAECDLEACWNRILTIFDPYTFLHSLGHELSIHHHGQNGNLATALPPAADQAGGSLANGAVCLKGAKL